MRSPPVPGERLRRRVSEIHVHRREIRVETDPLRSPLALAFFFPGPSSPFFFFSSSLGDS